MSRLVVVLLLYLCLSHGRLYAQGKPAPVQTDSGPVQALNGIKLDSTSDVSSEVVVHAVLLPHNVCKHIFGSEIADKYAVVQLTIANHDQTNSFLLQGIKLDYTHWLFSGTFAGLHVTPTVSSASDTAPKQSLVSNATAPSPYEAANQPYEVSSIESRIVRGELQDRQPWTVRNSIVRGAVLAGSVASGFTFLSQSITVLGVISAYGNQVVPGLQAFWPDSSQAQINRVSDYGFQTNHTISRSDIVMAFFPIDDFLTPSLKKVFKSTPAAFFNPAELILEPKYRGELLRVLKQSGVFGDVTDQQAAALVMTAVTDYETARLKGIDVRTMDPQKLLILYLLDRVSLNNVRVVVTGIMTTDTASVRPTIADVQFADDPTVITNWTVGATLHIAKIDGTFLSGGVVSVVVTGSDTTGAALTETILGNIVIDAANSNANTVTFRYSVGTTIVAGDKLSFVVSKKAKDGSTTSSAPFIYTVPSGLAPTITSLSVTGETASSTWDAGAVVNAKLSGANLTGAKVTVVSTDRAGKTTPAESVSVQVGATSTNIPLTFTFSTIVPVGTKLTFTVKTDSGSSTKDYAVPVAIH